MGKMQRIESYVPRSLGTYVQADSLWIRDYSGSFGKTHTLKVARNDTGLTKKIEKEFSYEDK